jgi:predicted dehydrogenase
MRRKRAASHFPRDCASIDMSDRLRIGLIGSGFSAHFHLASYAKVYGESFEVAAIAARDPTKVAALARQFNIACTYDSVEQMMRDPHIEVVDLCVPNQLHVPLILQAAAHGKHVICEKPLGGFFGPAGATPDWSAKGYSRQAMLEDVLGQSVAVEKAVRGAGITFCYAENWVYAPPVVKLNRLMAASGSTLMHIRGEESHSGSHASYSRRWRTAGGGSLLRMCAHPIGAALHLKHEEGRRRGGQPIRPVSVSAQVASLTNIASFQAEKHKHIVTGWEDVEDWATITVAFEDGAVAQLTSTDTRLGGIHNYITAYGSKAVVSANINPNTTCQAYTPAGNYFASEYLVEKTETKEGWSFPAPDEDAVTGYPEELRDFIGAIANKRAPKSGLSLAMDVMLVIYAGYVSAAEQRTIGLSNYLRR